MKRHLLHIPRWFLCVLLAGGPAVATAEVIERTLATRPDGELRIRNFSGSVHLRGWDRNEVELIARLDRDQELEVDEFNGRITIEVQPAFPNLMGVANLELRLPAGTRVQVTGVSTKIDVAGIHGELNLQTVSGSIRSSGFGDELRARTVSGDLDLEGSGAWGRVEVATVQGSIHLRGAAGALEVSTVNGDVRIDGGRFERVRLNVVSSTVSGQLELTDDARFEADSVAGAVNVRLPADLAARFDLQSFTGRIADCDGHSAEREGRHGPGKRLAFTRGDGGATVRAKTMSGAIELCNQGTP